MSKSDEQNTRRPGIWQIDGRKHEKDVLVYLGEPGLSHTGSIPAWTIIPYTYSVHYFKTPDGDWGVVTEAVDPAWLDDGQDITSAYMEDEDSAMLLATHLTGFMDEVLEGRPELLVPKAVIKLWMQCDAREIRVLAAKYAGRMMEGRVEAKSVRGR